MPAKLNEGDILEGIFCLAAGLLLAYENVDKNKLNQLRTVVDPSKFLDGRESVVVIKERAEGLDRNSVTCVIRLKAATTSSAFGKDYEVLYSSQKDVGNIDQKVTTIQNLVNSTSFAGRLLALKKKYTTNRTAESLDFVITADGIAGESSGGEIKGDVTVSFEVRDFKGKVIGSESLNYSIKSKSVTVSNLSPYKGMIKMAEAFGVTSTNLIKKYKPIFERPARDATAKEAVNQAMNEMYAIIQNEVIKKNTDPKFTERAFNFIKKEIFGSDLADLVDIQDKKIKEITKDYVDHISKNVKVKAIKTGQYLRIVAVTDPKSVLFSIRLKVRTSSSGSVERKFYIESGNMLYGGKK